MADVSYHSIAHRTAPQRCTRPVDEGGFGALANAPIATGDVVAAWGSEIGTGEQLAQYHPFIQTHSHQIEENNWQLPFLQERYVCYLSPYLQRCIDRWRQKQFTASRPAINGRASPTHITS
ncbi:MAG: hypothetical protein HND44_18750 [Chloroflexi bacterium]|nr:hypothetical protein [Ardenticatenaceae bacterium]MBL1130495.1 hypothetical protein [Chloroflexota bacterium]NOG36586.1 hypothetical protein [Chloroflexota bacterium]